VKAGKATITAAWNSRTGTAEATVTPATLLNLTIAPLNPSLPKGADLQMQAEGTYSDGTVQDVTALVTWSSADATIASISNATGSAGRVNAISPGTTEIRATLASRTATTRLTVTPAVLLSLKITPAQMTLEYKGTQKATATATYSDGAVVDVTDQTSWVSVDPLIASVSSTGTGRGLVSAGRAGKTTINASFGGKNGSIDVTVNAPKIVKLEIRPGTVSVPAGLDTQLRAFATFADGSEQEVTPTATWTSSSAHATVGNGSNAGKVIARSVGTATITASLEGFFGTAQVTVTAPLPDSLTISPTTVRLAAGLEQAFTVRAFFTDGSSQDVTTLASFTSADTSVVGLNANKAKGVREGGPITVTARYNGLTATAQVTVGPPILVSLALSTNGLVLQRGDEAQVRAIATYSDGSTRDVTAEAAWNSTDFAIASVANGLVKGIAPGNATITATHQGQSASAPVRVEA
ncbi:MAG: Ig-like domain-containing protein, partial [Myxococcales bacterium]